MNSLPGDPSLPPGARMADIDPPERRRDDAEDEQFWREWFDRIIEREHEKENLP